MRVKYHQGKKKKFLEVVAKLSEEELWLMSFSCWFCIFNPRFISIDESKYYIFPEKETCEATFLDFIEVIQFYNRKKVTPSREGLLASFLMTCDRSAKDFYLSLLSKNYIKGLPLVEVQEVLRLDSISSHDIYGHMRELQTSFSDLKFPVAIVGIPSPDLPLCLHSREPHTTLSKVQQGDGWVNSESHLPVDSVYIKTPRYTLAGYVSTTENPKRSFFHPIDFFEARKEYIKYLKGEEVTPFADRIVALRNFQKDNLLTQVSTGYIGFAHAPGEILPEVVAVMQENPNSYVVLVDKNTAATGNAHTVKVRIARGIIHDFWAENGAAKGYQLWFNGELFNCPFSFTGKNNSLLNNITPVKDKLFAFYYLKIGKTKIGVGQEILWGVKPWRAKRLRFSEMRIEKCALCGDSKAVHARRGICHTCECQLYTLFRHHGPNAWIQPAAITKRKRDEGCWESSLLNNVQYSHKGCLLVAREDGSWMFRED